MWESGPLIAATGSYDPHEQTCLMHFAMRVTGDRSSYGDIVDISRLRQPESATRTTPTISVTNGAGNLGRDAHRGGSGHLRVFKSTIRNDTCADLLRLRRTSPIDAERP